MKRTALAAIILTLATIAYGFTRSIDVRYGPQIEIFEPTAILAEQNITIRGRARNTYTLTVNDRLIYQEPSGDFSTQLFLPEGEATIIISAADKNGRTTIKKIPLQVQK